MIHYLLRFAIDERFIISRIIYLSYLCSVKNQKIVTIMIYSNITPQLLIEETYNYYGLKAELSVAKEFISRHISATPGIFYEWIKGETKDKLF